MSCKPNRDLIDAYVDGELDLVRSLELEQHLKECAACTQGHDRRESFVTAIKSAPLSYNVPADLEHKVRMAIHRHSAAAPAAHNSPKIHPQRRSLWMYGAIPLMAMGMALFVTIPRFLNPSADEQIGKEILAAHVRSLMADHLTDIRNSNQHVVKPWFNGRLDFSPPVKDFSDHGFPLTGGRLEYLHDHPAAALVYYRAAHPINLFVWPARAGEIAKEKRSTLQGYHLIRWTSAGMTFWAISDLNERDLKDFTDLVSST